MRGYIAAKNDTTQQSGQIPDKEVEINQITVCVNGYIETDPSGMLSPPTVWSNKVGLFPSQQSGQTPVAVCFGIRMLLQWKKRI